MMLYVGDMDKKGVGIITGVIAAGTVPLEFGALQIINRFVNEGWLPVLETTGQTMTIYLYLSQALLFVLAFIGVAGLGYWIGTRLDVSREYGTVFGSFALGGSIGYLCGMILVGAFFGTFSSEMGPLLGLSLVLMLTVVKAIQFALVGLAGAALAQFGFGRRSQPNGVQTSNNQPVVDTK